MAYSERRAPGLTITVENHWGVSTDIDRHLQIVDQVAAGLPAVAARAQFGCCFDPGNMPEGAGRARWWPALAARATHYHLKTARFDADGR